VVDTQYVTRERLTFSSICAAIFCFASYFVGSGVLPSKIRTCYSAWRHHCRFCGEVVCGACSRHRSTGSEKTHQIDHNGDNRVVFVLNDGLRQCNACHVQQEAATKAKAAAAKIKGKTEDSGGSANRSGGGGGGGADSVVFSCISAFGMAAGGERVTLGANAAELADKFTNQPIRQMFGLLVSARAGGSRLKPAPDLGGELHLALGGCAPASGDADNGEQVGAILEAMGKLVLPAALTLDGWTVCEDKESDAKDGSIILIVHAANEGSQSILETVARHGMLEPAQISMGEQARRFDIPIPWSLKGGNLEPHAIVGTSPDTVRFWNKVLADWPKLVEPAE
jgi:hypothetical protein